MSRRAAFLDRDGVVNLDHGYVFRQQDFQFVPGTLAAAAALAARGFVLVVVTNQSGIGRGLYTEQDVAVLHAWMRQQFAGAGAAVAGVYYCPHHPVDATGQYRVECDCRKPAPGLLLRASHELDLDLARSVLFGDKESDLQAALAAGVPARVLLGTDGALLPRVQDGSTANLRFRSLAEAVASAVLWARLGEASHA
jgi:D-glycero-D-manno-heptose 1,7-bisphosphate phosphatase